MTASNDKWNIDKVLLNPGGVVDILNRFGDRERELLQKISDLTDELRAVKASPAPVKKSVEDYALAALAGLFADPGYRFDPAYVFEVAEVMVAERDKRGDH